MSIQMPEHVIKLLSEDTKESPEHMKFKLLNMSGQHIYLWFIEKKIGFVVTENIWECRSMAQASSVDDNKTIPFKQLDLSMIGLEDVRIYPDFSLSWTAAKIPYTNDNIETRTQIKEWKEQLLQKGNTKWVKLTMRSQFYKQIANSLESLELKLSI